MKYINVFKLFVYKGEDWVVGFATQLGAYGTHRHVELSHTSIQYRFCGKML